MYAAQPAFLVKACESTSRPLIPKSHSFTLPCPSSRMLEGFTSVEGCVCGRKCVVECVEGGSVWWSVWRDECVSVGGEEVKRGEESYFDATKDCMHTHLCE